MKQRFLSAAVGLSIFFAVLFFYNTYFLNISAAIVIAVAIYELMNVTKTDQSKPLLVVCLLFGVCSPFFSLAQMSQIKLYATALFALALFCILVFDHEHVRAETVAMAFSVTCLVSFSMSIMTALREFSSGAVQGIYYTMLGFGLAWLTDTGAYLVGITFGKHKLAPKISPKKTVEGAVGGLVFCMITIVLFSLFYTWVCSHFWNITLEIDYLRLLVLTPFAALISMLGDLAASVIKRQYGVKDFGSVIPGHGGIMDRFDSVLFVFPVLYLFIQLFPIV